MSVGRPGGTLLRPTSRKRRANETPPKGEGYLGRDRDALALAAAEPAAARAGLGIADRAVGDVGEPELAKRGLGAGLGVVITDRCAL